MCLKAKSAVQTRPWVSGSQGGDRRKRWDLKLLLRSAVVLSSKPNGDGLLVVSNGWKPEGKYCFG